MARIIPYSIASSESFNNSNFIFNKLEINNIVSGESFGTALLDTSTLNVPNFESAIILNNLVKAYNITVSQLDFVSKLQSFAIGGTANTNPRLNYGFTSLSSNKYNQIYNKIVLSQGLLQNGESDLKLLSFYPNLNTFQEGYKLSDIFSSNDDLSNCYILGGIYATLTGNNYTIDFRIAKSAGNVNGNDLIYSKDCSLDEIENILFFSNEISIPKPENTSILLFKFVIDVDKYYNDINLDRYIIYLYDLRAPEGFYGLGQENLLFSITNNMISGNQGIISVKNAELDNIKSIIQSWVNMESWYPDFESYWAVNERTLPDELLQFLADEMDIVI